MEFSLLIIALTILILPLVSKYAENNIEIFLCVMGVTAVNLTNQWTFDLVGRIITEPLQITGTVLIFGYLFSVAGRRIHSAVLSIKKSTGNRMFVFYFTVLLGLASSICTAIIAALILSETMKYIRLERKTEIRITVLACFSIGMGAILTPVGEPLSAIVNIKLQAEPYNADFWFLLRNFWYYIIPGIFAIGIVAALLTGDASAENIKKIKFEQTRVNSILITALKVYVFLIGLILLGKGFEPLIDKYITRIPYYAIYWINMISAVLDNATLAAAEISSDMSVKQIISAVLGLVIAGGMLIPGNIPNIIVSNKNNITSRQWASFAVPVGLGLYLIYFFVLMAIF